jgi:hypothetical protein
MSEDDFVFSQSVYGAALLRCVEETYAKNEWSRIAIAHLRERQGLLDDLERERATVVPRAAVMVGILRKIAQISLEMHERALPGVSPSADLYEAAQRKFYIGMADALEELLAEHEAKKAEMP